MTAVLPSLVTYSDVKIPLVDVQRVRRSERQVSYLAKSSLPDELPKMEPQGLPKSASS